MFNFSGKPPASLGVHDGRLAPCGKKPNCVSSQSEAEIKGEGPHHVHPFTFAGDPEVALQRLARVLRAQPRITVVTQTDRYLHAECATALMGFVDDLEFYLMPDERLIHVRSASRLGYSDWGVNRARVEALREAFDNAAQRHTD